MSSLVTGLFENESGAESAVAQLKQIGYGQNEITIIMKDRQAATEFAHETGSRSLEGVGAGAAIGGTIGAVLAGLLAVGSVTIPGVGLIAAGSLAAMLAGAGAGGLTGGLIGWLSSAGIPAEAAPYYERGLSTGGVVVAVAAHAGDEAHVEQILRYGAAVTSGNNMPLYVNPPYQQRFETDRTSMADTRTGIDAASMPLTQSTIGYDSEQKSGYDMATHAHEAKRTANDVETDVRTAERERSEHEREALRDSTTAGPISGTAHAVENIADKIGTATSNTADKVGNAIGNTADRVAQP